VFAPTTGHAPVQETTALVVAPQVLALDGRSVGGGGGPPPRAPALTFVVPRTAGDLERWSRLLRNCLDSYGPAAAAGASTIIGVERSGELRYALELTRSGIVRQFVGPANRPVAAADRRQVVGVLVEAGLVDATQPANAPWLTPS
jgi:hypothetical protein